MLRLSVMSLLLGLTILISGCAQPQNPQEFRQVYNDGHKDRIKTYNVKRPYKAVINSLKKNAHRCLDKRVTYPPSWIGGEYQSGGHNDYKSKLKVGENNTTLTFQYKFGGALHIEKWPDDGLYFYVADIFPHGKNQTKVQLYYGNGLFSMDDNVIIKSLRAWIDGKNGCPDLTKIW